MEPRLDLVHDRIEPGGRDGALLARLDQAGSELLAVEGLPPAVLLDDDVGDLFDRLVGGEATPAGRALASPADDLPFAALAGVHDPVVHAAAEGALHAGREA